MTKHCNIIYQGGGVESFVDIKDLQRCRVNKIDWAGREVYVGVDLSMSNDNTAVAICAEEDGKILADVICFVPEGRLEEKNKFEKLDYRQFIANHKCIPCGNKTIDYGVVEGFVFSIEEKYGVTIRAIGYDRYNALSSAQKWNQKYNTVQIRQHSDTIPVKNIVALLAWSASHCSLFFPVRQSTFIAHRAQRSENHPPTKLLSEKITNGEFEYEKK